MSHDEWNRRYYGQLQDRRIVVAGVGDDGFPFFQLDNGVIVSVSQDPEGNGPGFLFGLPDPR